MVGYYRKVAAMMDVLDYFTMNEWKVGCAL